MKDNTKKLIEETIVESYKSNINLKKEIDDLKLQLILEKNKILLDIVQIVDTFEKAEQTIAERGWGKIELSEQPIKRLLTAKKKTLSVLEKYNVSKITFTDNIANDEECKTIDTEPDNNNPNNYIISIEKTGYKFEEKILRPAEVIVVKN
jgi:molecular chaperone GrpE (heat shock protein)